MKLHSSEHLLHFRAVRHVYELIHDPLYRSAAQIEAQTDTPEAVVSVQLPDMVEVAVPDTAEAAGHGHIRPPLAVHTLAAHMFAEPPLLSVHLSVRGQAQGQKTVAERSLQTREVAVEQALRQFEQGPERKFGAAAVAPLVAEVIALATEAVASH